MDIRGLRKVLKIHRRLLNQQGKAWRHRAERPNTNEEHVELQNKADDVGHASAGLLDP